ncbi:hypothetical protein JE952_002465 [Flavobacterium psychrophilum]|nr:hypothetical protein [Flavobacterium psychrophilum]
MKKLILLSSFLFSLISYSQTEKLIGEWTNCESTCDGITMNRNVCTKIEFKSNHTAIITYPGAVENLKWKLTDNVITFASIEKEEKNSLFSSSKTYLLIFNATFKELSIMEQGKEKCYELLLR